MLRRLLSLPALLSLLALASLAAASASRASVSQTPDVTDTHYSSLLERVYPVVKDVSWKVIDLNDEIRLINHSGKTVTVYAYPQTPNPGANYSGGQYARIESDGTVQVNENSPAYYLNDSFYEIGVNVPSSASATAAPNWVTLARTSTFYWHDHRIHYASPATPLQVTDVHRRTLVDSWYVPIQVGSRRGYLYGKLYWNAEKSFSFPIGAIIGFIVVVLGGAALVVVVRRRRGPAPSREAW
jgi:hypothetical protein